jgi:hypothetical protein
MTRAMRPYLVSAFALLAACGQAAPAAIDGSSPEAYRTSVAEVRGQLGPADRARFEAALKLAQAEAFAKADSRAEMDERLRRKLDGRTGAEVIAEAQAKRAKVADAAVDELFDLKKHVRKGAEELKAVRDAVGGGGE